MKVKDLLRFLSNCPPDLEVIVNGNCGYHQDIVSAYETKAYMNAYKSDDSCGPHIIEEDIGEEGSMNHDLTKGITPVHVLVLDKGLRKVKNEKKT
jgi:hypothetical protein